MERGVLFSPYILLLENSKSYMNCVRVNYVKSDMTAANNMGYWKRNSALSYSFYQQFRMTYYLNWFSASLSLSHTHRVISLCIERSCIKMFLLVSQSVKGSGKPAINILPWLCRYISCMPGTSMEKQDIYFFFVSAHFSSHNI